MNRRGVLGQALTSVPSLIIVFLVMLFFVIVSSAIAKNHENSYNLLEDFLNDYTVYEGKVVTVNEIVNLFCKDMALAEKIKPVLRQHFIEEYGFGHIFTLSYVINEGQLKIISWAGLVDSYINEDGTISDYESYNKLVNPNSNSVKRICNGVDIFAKRGDR